MEGGAALPLDAALVKPVPEWATFTFHMTIKEERDEMAVNEDRVKEEPECASSATCASGTGAGPCADAGAARVARDERELAPERIQHEPKISDHVRVHLREGSETLPDESLFILEPSDTDRSVKKYSCKICKKKFRKDYLKIHERYHTGEKPYACDICAKSFARASNLKTHKLSHTGEKPFSCKICEKRFTQTSNLKKHLRIHSGEKPYGCTICKKLFRQWIDLDTHKKTHAGATQYSCKICKVTFMQLGAFKTHKLIHMEENGARGELYAQGTKDEHMLGPGDRHRPNTVNALGEKPESLIRDYEPALTTYHEPAATTSAEHETAQNNTFSDTLQHITHTYMCGSCGEIFQQKQYLIDHVKVHLRERSVTLPNKSSILEPSATDMSETKYSCKICKKRFRKDYLKIHERLHTGQKAHACEVCKKQFATLGSLREHKRIHTEIRPYSCDVCAKSFVRLDHLKIHERSHTGEKPYKCETCKKAFSQLPNLQSHIRTHTGEKPYVCTTCDKQFTQWSALHNHKKTHSVENPHSCEITTDPCAASEKYKERTRVREESKCESRADSCSVSETGSGVDLVMKVELELGPEGAQQRDIPIAPGAAPPRRESESSTDPREASETHKETRVKEVSEMGANGDHVIEVEPELAPGHTQLPNTFNTLGEKSQFLVSNYRPALDHSADISHREPAGTTDAEHDTVQHNTTTLQHTAKTQTYMCGTCGEIFLQKQCLIDHFKVHLQGGSDTVPNESSILEPINPDTNVKKYSCKICKKKFRKNYLKIHESYHTGEKPHACEVCKKQFATSGSLREHKRIHTEGRPYSCDVCAKSFARVDHLKIHERSHTGEKPYKCEMCKKGFSQLATLQSHIRTHTKERPFSCTMCHKQFTQWSSLNKHKRSHANKKPFSCETCKKTFRKKSSFEKHKHKAVSVKEKTECESSTDPCGASETHKETRVKEEPKCGSSADSCRVSETGASVDHVIKIKLELGPEGVQRRDTPVAPRENSWSVAPNYKPALDRCAVTAHDEPAGATGADHDTAQHNTITDTPQHTAGTNSYKCDTCGQIFLQKQCLIDHVIVHLREEPETLPNESLFTLEPSVTDTSVKKYPCKICKKQFRKDYLKIHARLHTGQKPYACEICKKQFAAPGNLRDHKRVHIGERPYSCDVCGKSFARLDHLKIHERIHTGQKPYKCEICNKGFSQLTNLQSHIRTHTGENPYACTMCDKQFRQWSSLNKHNRSHTVENLYSCEISKNCFQQPGTLNVHKIMHTNKKPFSCVHKHDAVSEKKSECESNTDPCGASEMHKETRVMEEPKLRNSADSCRVSETGASVDHVIKVELELGPGGIQQLDTPIAPRAASPRRELLGTTSGASGAKQPSSSQETNMTTETLQATTAGTHVIKLNHVTIDKQTRIKRPYTCDICNKTFTQSGSLKTHKRIHTGEKPYSCEVCNKQFTALATFNNHKITAHTQVRPYACEICNKSFKLLASLKTHGRIHTESKRYSCDICKRQFRYMSALRVHNRIHTGVKPYGCEICKQQFTKKSSVNTHIIHMHAGEKPFSCEICKRQFATKWNLKYHIGTHAKHES